MQFKNFMKLISPLLVFPWLVTALLSQSSPAIDYMYDIADLVVEGTIFSKTCDQWELGVLSCSYIVQIDSIYKGIPELRTDESSDEPYAWFHRNCFYFLNLGEGNEHVTADRCYNRKDRLIFFFKKIGSRMDYLAVPIAVSCSLIDNDVGAVAANPYLSRYLRQLPSKQE